jgi:hypothetical protein
MVRGGEERRGEERRGEGRQGGRGCQGRAFVPGNRSHRLQLDQPHGPHLSRTPSHTAHRPRPTSDPCCELYCADRRAPCDSLRGRLLRRATVSGGRTDSSIAACRRTVVVSAPQSLQKNKLTSQANHPTDERMCACDDESERASCALGLPACSHRSHPMRYARARSCVYPHAPTRARARSDARTVCARTLQRTHPERVRACE